MSLGSEVPDGVLGRGSGLALGLRCRSEAERGLAVLECQCVNICCVLFLFVTVRFDVACRPRVGFEVLG